MKRALSSAEAERCFWGGEDPLSIVSAGAGLLEGRKIDPFDFAPTCTLLAHRIFDNECPNLCEGAVEERE